MPKKTLFFMFLSMSFCAGTNAAESTYMVHCPATIDVSQQSTSMYPDWRVIVEKKQPHFLSNITLYSGAPEEQASLVPEFSEKNSKATWTFSTKDRIYVACGYQKTNLRLSQALPEGITRCTLTYNLQSQGDSGFLPEEMTCQKTLPPSPLK